MDIPRVIFMGSGKIGLPTLHWLATTDIVNLVGIVTQQDKPVGRAQIVTPPPPKVLAKDRGIPVLQPEKIRRPEVLESIQQLAPDVIIVMAYGQILPKALLDLSTIACLNLHASLLPKHRGASPIQTSILAGDTTTGITVMYMAEGLDTGDILSARALPVCRRETGESLHDRLALLGPEALTEALALLLVGKAPRIAQEGSLANYTPKLDRESGRLDWSASCYDLERRIRAMYSWPGAYTLVNVQGGGTPKKLKIHRAFPLHRFSGVPGEVLQINSRGIVVACGAGGLLLLTVQLEGKRRMSAIEFLRGFSLGPGVVLGG